EIAVAQRGEDDGLPVGRQRPLGVVARVVGQAALPRAVGIGDVDVIVVDRPHVTARVVRPRGTGHAGVLGAGIEDPRIVRKEVPAGRPAEAARDAPQPRAVGVHDVFLIAAGRVFGRLALQYQRPAGRGPIRLGVLPAEGELTACYK